MTVASLKQDRGRPPSLARPVITTLPLYSQTQRIGGQQTPQSVSAIIREADQGYVDRFVDLANECRQRDSHLQSLLHTREVAVAELPWAVEPTVPPGERKPADEDREIAMFVETALRSAQGRGGRSRSFTDVLSHLAGAIYFGYAVAEIEWEKHGGKLLPSGFRDVAPRRFQFSQLDGALEWFDRTIAMGGGTGVRLEEKHPDKFVIHQPRINGDVPSREGLARVLLWPSFFRTWSISDWLRLAELAWKPWRMGEYKDGASDKDIDDLVTALEQLTNNGIATFSERAKVHVQWPERNRGTPSQHGELCAFMAMEMSKAVLGQTLTIEAGARGARSLGDVHDRVRKDIAEADALAMATTIRRDLIEPLVRLNFGPNAAVPEFKLISEDTPELNTFARGIKTLVDAGVEIPQWWPRDKAGIPEPEPGEQICVSPLFGGQAPVVGATDKTEDIENDGEDENEETDDEQPE